MISFWEKNSLLHYDAIIIGSGLNGLNIAIKYKEKHPDAQVLIVERGTLPYGASTRNAGFACFGSFSEILSDIEENGLDLALELVEWRVKGMQMHLEKFGPQFLDYQANGGGELVLKNETLDIESISEINKLLKPILGTDPFNIDDSKIKTFGYNPNLIKHYINNSCEGQIDTGLFVKNLWQMALKLGIYFMSGTEILEIQHQKDAYILNSKNNINQFLEIQGKHLFVCTNAFAKQLLPDLDILPARGQILITKAIENLKIKGIFHFDKGYHYFRNYKNRIIYGGARNLDFETENTSDFEINNQIQSHLIHNLKNLILPNTEFEIDMQWCGIMAFGKNKFPIIKAVKPNLIVCAKMGGMGLALSAISSSKALDLILD